MEELHNQFRDGVLHPVHGWIPSVAISRILDIIVVLLVLIRIIHDGHDATEELSLRKMHLHQASFLYELPDHFGLIYLKFHKYK
jgi:hypothetical protein